MVLVSRQDSCIVCISCRYGIRSLDRMAVRFVKKILTWLIFTDSLRDFNCAIIISKESSNFSKFSQILSISECNKTLKILQILFISFTKTFLAFSCILNLPQTNINCCISWKYSLENIVYIITLCGKYKLKDRFRNTAEWLTYCFSAMLRRLELLLTIGESALNDIGRFTPARW